jgi:hypothetical protein
MNQELKESVEFFDKYVNASLSNKIDGYTALDVVKHYNIVKAELAKVLTEKE